MTPACEVFLFMASRAELVAQVIKPALDKGGVVISDRFLLASVVYQGHAGGLPVEELWRMGHVATGGVEPELTLILDMPVAAALARRGRPADRIESRTLEYQEKVRQGFLTEANSQPERIVVIDAQGEVNEIQEHVRIAVNKRLK
jgi:dTMP kinase